MDIPDEEFGRFIEEAVDSIPEPYRSRIDNVAFIIEDDPSPEQRLKLNLYPNETLYGLYEGLPLPQRGGMTKLLPDKITIFKKPLLAVSPNLETLKLRLGHTVWHEVAHYFGLDHKRIHELDAKMFKSQK